MRRILPLLIALLALVGTVDSAYLAARYVSAAKPGEDAICDIAGGGCETLEKTSEATVMGVPTALLGLGYFGFVLLMSVWRIWTGRWPFVRFLEVALSIGLLFSFYLVYVLLFELEVACPYCLAAHAANVLIVLLYAISRRLDVTRPLTRRRWAMGTR